VCVLKCVYVYPLTQVLKKDGTADVPFNMKVKQIQTKQRLIFSQITEKKNNIYIYIYIYI